MAKTMIYPSVINYIKNVSESALNVKSLGISDSFLKSDIASLVELTEKMKYNINYLESKIKEVQKAHDCVANVARMWRDNVLSSMEELRCVVDKIEAMVDSNIWPMPTYVDLLFGI